MDETCVPEDVSRGEVEAQLSLQLTRGLGVRRIGQLLERFGTAEGVVEASEAGFRGLHGVTASGAARLSEALGRVRSEGLAVQELERCAEAGVRLVVRGGAGYPVLLRDLPDAPPVLWVRGRVDGEDRLTLAVVGSRRCSGYGRRQAEVFAGRCASLGFTIVSGGAIGVDGVAHRSAVRSGGTTVAVIGSGLGRPYPERHEDLFHNMVDSGRGGLMSELPMLTPPSAENFPRRNRIISGMSLGTLVIEAGERSGALITARICVEEHGRELMAVPGPVDSGDSAGCHRVIREQWATLVTQPEEVLEQIAETRASLLVREEPVAKKRRVVRKAKEEPAVAKPVVDPLATLEGVPRAVAEVLREPLTLDQVVERVGRSMAEVQSVLTRLEIKGLVVRCEGRLRLRH
ncbi:DNA-processing protein DprA [Mucisphaera calidilacus]|uniref:Uncharacterized protein n=1 Tax=Mucisphaera calidilacus TaxID=2527982 RepID=A0A518BZM7_9BACT|nr:DNA-processing protein DprA [Mucisphaera calidilacus]QDU72426.1 hypothetical protein Pan265_22910 [Mucisphaera calidilacus]